MGTWKKILVVEDNELNRAMLVEILSDRYQALEAENGYEALEILKQNREKIALILLDVEMPLMNGYTFLDIIKQDPDLSLIPVIIMPQSNSEEDEIAALAHGASDFVPKPYRAQVILHRIASIIHLRETAAMINQFQYDRLTGLYSKEFFFQRAQEIILSNPEKEYNIVCSNIVNFKLYNDTFGTPAGDRLLRDFAAATSAFLGEEGITGRFSADRFAFLQERSPERKRCAVFARNLRMHPPEGLKNVDIKWGIYEIVDKSLPVEHMCDRAMLAADNIRGQYGRDVAVYDDILRKKLLREQSITSSMEDALRNRQFVLFLQPKYRASDGGLCGAEALVRWIHPEWGLLSPGEYVPLFERNGFISKLDQYIWEEACALLCKWREQGYPPMPLSVNVSRADLFLPELPELILGLTQKYGVDPRLLHLEITENAYTGNSKQIMQVVDQLRSKGFIVERDDFGSGYSSLNMLSQLKLDTLKLDMGFVQSETQRKDDRGVLRMVVEMAHRMKLSVVAEGVETQKQLDLLRECGCDYVQGYLFSKPVPQMEYETLLRRLAEQQDMPATPKGPITNNRQYLLVAEEDAYCRELLARGFADRYDVVTAESSRQALTFLETHGQEIAVLIVSITLPEAGAQAVISALRQQTAQRRIPVIAMTLPQFEQEARNANLDVDDIAFKPRDTQCLYCLRGRVEWVNRMTAYQARERVMVSEAYRDYLTALLNRRGLQAAIDSMQKEDYPLAVYLFDLDDLKKTNDRHGHGSGDQMLKQFAGVLRQNTRGGDILCRYGGDEFAVILKGVRSMRTVLRKGRDICRGMAQLENPDGTHPSCSGGVAVCDDVTVPPSMLIERADQALYQAKRSGKGTCILWTPEEA